MLDKLPAWARHLVLMLAPVLLAWIASDVIPALQTQGGNAALVAAALGVAVSYGLMWLTPVSRQYGVGSDV